jgi:diguanylate cyclase (GGDEF)-like protein/PAS domain S-box-containing protein
MPRILVIDDDASALLLMRAALARAGFEVSTVADGERGLALFRDRPFDAVMLDVEMPGMDGFEVCARLRQEVGEEMPIVMVTGMDDIASIERAYEAGATDFIAKPINLALIGHRLRYLLRGSQTLRDLRTAIDRHQAVLKAIPDLLFELDADGRYIDYHSPRADMLAVPPERFLGRALAEIMPEAAARVCMEALDEAAAQGTSTGRQFSLRLPQGETWFELSVSRKAGGEGGRPHFIVLTRNVTERKEAERRIARLAYYDALTGLPNRQSFLERVDREIRRAEGDGQRLGVLFMDLDGFKHVNDTMGHSAGDLLLQRTADRLRDGLRPSDVVARGAEPDRQIELARLGGDEFTALIVGLGRPQDAMAVAQRVLQLMRRPFEISGRQVLLTASIGIAVFPDDGADAATLLQHADTAMYLAKEVGRDNCQFYSRSLTEAAIQRLELESSLRLALERGEFTLEYQPQLEAASGRVVAVEALIRWQHPSRGTVPPADFIPLAEDTGLIVPIGRWALRAACAQAARWQRAGRRLRVAVNLSPLQFRDPLLVRNVLDILAETGLAPQLLELEVTESAVMVDNDATMATLRALRDAGVGLALDDFGTGYSSMSQLKRMPITHLKIDRSFVRDLPDDADDLAIVRAILSMAKSLGFTVTAEGVETAEQAQLLGQTGCDWLQGRFFSWPVPASEVLALVDCRWRIPTRPAQLVGAGG